MRQARTPLNPSLLLRTSWLVPLCRAFARPIPTRWLEIASPGRDKRKPSGGAHCGEHGNGRCPRAPVRVGTWRLITTASPHAHPRCACHALLPPAQRTTKLSVPDSEITDPETRHAAGGRGTGVVTICTSNPCLVRVCDRRGCCRAPQEVSMANPAPPSRSARPKLSGRLISVLVSRQMSGQGSLPPRPNFASPLSPSR